MSLELARISGVVRSKKASAAARPAAPPFSFRAFFVGGLEAGAPGSLGTSEAPELRRLPVAFAAEPFSCAEWRVSGAERLSAALTAPPHPWRVAEQARGMWSTGSQRGQRSAALLVNTGTRNMCTNSKLTHLAH